jgi:hypothetical protein
MADQRSAFEPARIDPLIEKRHVARKQKAKFDGEPRKVRAAINIEYAFGMQQGAKEQEKV